MEELKAYWQDRIPQLGICVVKSINYEDNRAEISNGAVRVFPKLDQIQLIRPTGILDADNRMIHEFDYVDDGDNIYEVKWYPEMASFWLYTVIIKDGTDMDLGLDNHQLGTGRPKRDDLTNVGNKFETKYLELTKLINHE